jgi:hypothetical protein
MTGPEDDHNKWQWSYLCFSWYCSLTSVKKKKFSSGATFRFIIWIFRRVIITCKDGSLEMLRVSYFPVDFSRGYLSGRILIDTNIQASACKDWGKPWKRQSGYLVACWGSNQAPPKHKSRALHLHQLIQWEAIYYSMDIIITQELTLKTCCSEILFAIQIM